jgi:PKD repeat protein
VQEGRSTILSFNSPFDPGAADTAAGFRYSFDCTGDGVFDVQDSADGAINCAYQDDGIYTTTGRIKDKDGGLTDYITLVTVSNVSPNVGPISAPHDPARVSTTIVATAPFQDAGVLDTHTAVWDWGDGNTSDGTVNESQGSGQVSGSHEYLSPGVYSVRLIVHDDDGGIGEAMFEYVVVYDAEGGFVTGGGWINSPAGACQLTPACQTTAGRATFGFVSKYKKGAGVPTGTTQFQFQAGGLNFHSSSYQWLVIAGPKAVFKGNGTINGQGYYGFMLSAIDGQINGGGGADKFRIKIWDTSTGAVIYDNQMNDPETGNPTTILGGGSIVIHRGSLE